jgi:hypothetical protein
VIAAATGVAAAALSVSPVRIRLTRAASRTITITNAGNSSAVVDASPAGFVFDRRGKPTIVPKAQRSGGWLRLRPRRLVLAPGGTGVVTVSSAAPTGASPGDHPALVLFTTKPPRAAAIAVRMRVGVVVFVRVAGRIVHRLELGRLKARRRVLEAAVVNRGNVVERARVRVLLLRHGRVLARLRSAGRTVLAHSRAVARFGYPRRLRGWVTARVDVGAQRRTLRIRLRR